jgi:hypothetical protein
MVGRRMTWEWDLPWISSGVQDSRKMILGARAKKNPVYPGV